MQLTPKFQVSTLWRGDKGRELSQFPYFPLGPASLDGYGVWFTKTNSHELWLCNAQHDGLIYMNMQTKRHEVLKNPLAPSLRLVGGFGQGEQLVVLATYSRHKQPALVATLNRKAEALSTLQLEADVPLPPPVWFRPFRGSYLCFHRYFDLKSFVGKGQLLQYSAKTGARMQVVEEVWGVAISSDGRTMYYVSNNRLAGEGWLLANRPEGLEPSRWLLLGCDQEGRLYWYNQTRRGRWNASHIACADSQGTVLWKVPLTGQNGILAEIDDRLQVRLGWGGEWIEVLPEGDILVFAWSGSEKVRSGVGVYQVKWIGTVSSRGDE